MNVPSGHTKTERTVSSATRSCGVWGSIGVTVCLLTLAVPLTASALSVTPTAVSFSAEPGGTLPAPQSITFWKGNDRAKNWTISANSSWVAVTPTSGILSTEQGQITVSVNPTGLSGGTYSTSIVIAMEGLKGRIQRTTIPVSLTVGGTGSTPSISLSPSTLSFSGVAGGTAPNAQQITLTNPSGGTLSWTTSDDAAWLNLSIGSGTTTTETDSISASVNPTGLAAGTYTAAVTISASGAANTPQVIPVTLMLGAPPTSTPVISLNVPSLTFTGTSGGSNPSAQSFTISNTGTGTLTWTAGDDAAWLSLSPASGTNTGTVAAAVNLTGLTAGTYSGTIIVSATGATSKTLPVSFTVKQPTTAGAVNLTWAANTEPDLAGYKVYVGTQSGVYGPPITVGNVTTYQLNNLTMNTTYFVSITAVDTAGNESLHSAEVSKSVY
ncbi:MAG TPA: fibronectin type III domain-containing protein [Nitrospira sp.]|nr:fibronectin type III domain-containing protein [Nitrospira sp.]